MQDDAKLADESPRSLTSKPPPKKQPKRNTSVAKQMTSCSTSTAGQFHVSPATSANKDHGSEPQSPLPPAAATSSTASHDIHQVRATPSITPVPLQHLSNGISYGGFYVYKEGVNEKILPMFATPVRYAKDHSYAATKDTSRKRLTYEEQHMNDNDSSCAPSASSTLPSATALSCDEEESFESDDATYDDFDDSDYIQPTESECDSETDEEFEQNTISTSSIYQHSNAISYAPELKQEKYIVFEDNLKELMRFCMKCGSPVTHIASHDKGSSVSYTMECHNGCKNTWSTQPPIASLMIASSIISTGNTYSKVASFAKAMNLKFIGKTTYQDHQKGTIVPIVQRAWEEERAKVVEEMKQKQSLILAGDARCDSVGYNAKYGSYTLMDTSATSGTSTKKKIVSMELVQVSEVPNSNHMEPKGLERCLDQIKQDGLKPKALATDRHLMVTSIMKKNHKDIDHQFDIWHLVKSILKKLMAKAKLKKCEELMHWVRSITNHLWWCAESCGGNAQLLHEKWLSVLNNIINKHKWSGSQLFHKCAPHPYQQQRKKKLLGLILSPRPSKPCNAL